MKKRLVMGTAVGALVVGALVAGDLEAQSQRRLVSVTIGVETTKENGQPWDVGGGAPDINLCVTLPGQSQECQPRHCQDSFRCRPTDVIWEPGSEILVRDIDIANHDQIGRGRCVFNEQCFIGRATVVVGPNG